MRTGEKRKRKLQELEALTASNPSPSSASTSDSSNDGAHNQANAGEAVESTQNDAGTRADGDGWLFDFVSPAVVDISSAVVRKPFGPGQTTHIAHTMNFPERPTEGQCTELARVVRNAYTRAQKPMSVADPYSNHLNVEVLSFAKAFFANQLHLGMVESEFCQQKAQSSFYRAKVFESPYAETMILAVQRSFEGLKPDLRPTTTQIVKSHHPAIDVLPFPDLRSRLIKGLSQDPPLLNESDFWEDLQAGAIICWGNANAELGGGGVPWDARSWEAKPWFLDKWRHVLGDEHGELWQASRWWREMRGEFL